jgi:plasmid stabilization system protein ParE
VNRTKAPSLFADELGAAFALIEELPYAGEAVPHPRIPGLRRLLLGSTQYYVYYSVADDEPVVDVLALWHTSRGTLPRF